MSDSKTKAMEFIKQISALQKANKTRSSTHCLDIWFKYHAPTPEDVLKYDKINEAAKAFAKVVFEECIEGKDQESALWLIRQARMSANSSIACKGV
jgi:hypothetical protein